VVDTSTPEQRCIGRQRVKSVQQPKLVVAPSKWMCDHSVMNEANSWRYQSHSLERDERLLPGRPSTAEITMWPWVIGALSLAAVVNQVVIALCRRAQAATESDPHEGW
jgi:hypothetical protein